MKQSMWIRVCLALLLGFFAIGNGSVCAADRLVLQLPWHHQFQFAGYYMAKEQGYYSDAGLSVEIRDVSQGIDAVEEVLSGRADFGVSGPGLIVERSLGKPIVAVAATFQQSLTVFLSLEQSDIRKPADLIGKKVMLSPGYQSLPLLALLHQEKLLDKIERLETSFDCNSLLNGQTDVFNGYRSNEPYQLETQGYATNIIDPGDYGIHFYGDTLFASKVFLQNNPKRAEKFRVASLKGWGYALKHPDKTIAVIRSKYQGGKTVQQLQFEAAAIKKAIQPDLVEIGTMEWARWAQINHHLMAIGQIPPEFHLPSDFLYTPPLPIQWQALRPWIAGVLAVFTTTLIFIFIVSRAYFRLRTTRKQLWEEIEERKQAEEALSEASRIINRSPTVAFLWKNVEGWPVEFVSDNVIDLLGYSLQDFLEGKIAYNELIHQDDFEKVAEEVTTHSKRKECKSFAHSPYRVITKSGETIWVNDTTYIRRDDQGEATYFEGVVHDITALKQAEEARSQLLQAIDQSSETIVITDKSGAIQYVNPAFEKISGYTREEVIGQNPRIFKSDQQDGAIYPEMWKTLTEGEVWRGQFVNKKKDGTLYIEDATIAPVFDSLGKVVNYIAVKRDITHEVEMEEQLRQKYKMEAIGVMAGGMAHNFNNNLAIILGNIELSQLKLPKESETAPLLKNAKIAVLRSRDLIQQILTYSRQGAYTRTSIQLSQVLDESLKLLQSTIPATINVREIVSMSSRDITINGDASQIQEILINLCNNAVHAMDEQGDLTLSLDMVNLEQKDISAEYKCLPGCYAKLSIQDNGSGMSTETIGKIFDLFFTTKDVNEGTGVGLSTVRGIVDQHDGMIEVNSVLGEGTTFDLYFPIIDRRQKERAPAVQELPRGNEKVLFLDDDEMIANVWSETLREYGYQVSTMTSSTEALKLFAANADYFDMVVTDQTMPDLVGMDLIQKLLKIRPDILTILCTGYSSKINEGEAIRLGISAFCMKPLELPELLLTMRRVLDGEN